MAVVREDVVKLSFEYDKRGMTKATDAVDDLLAGVQALGGADGTGKAEDGFDSARKAAKKFGDTDFDDLINGLDTIANKAGQVTMKLGKMAVKGIVTGIATSVTAIAALGTSAIKNYAEYEQLIGGVETLFGAGGMSLEDYAISVGKTTDEVYGDYKSLINAQDTVLKNSNKAWKTAGMSANEYMGTVTGFSASLIQSLGGDTLEASKMADMAVIDMADNANKMGTNMEDIQNAYQGFAKQNYTMLDNLKLGYGGTKEEMERLLKDAEAITGKKYNLNNFADIVEAIHVIQTEMGIAGTTAEEASKTIQGSALAMKAAWFNFIVGMANEDADFDQLLGDLVESVKTFANNLIPRIKIMLPRLIKGLAEIARHIGKELPGIIAELLPALIEGGISLMSSLVGALIDSGPMFKKAVLEIAKAIYKGFTGKDMTGDMFEKLEATVDRAFAAIKNIISGVVEFGGKMMDVIGPALVWVGEMALTAFEWIGENIDWLLPVLGSLLGALLAFSAVKRVSSVVSGFMSIFRKPAAGVESLTGAAGDGSGGFLGSFANIKPKTVLKSMLNLAIVIGGLVVLGAAIALVAPYIASLSDAESLIELLAIVAVLGVVGTGLAKVASIAGKIPVAKVAKGLANIAIMLGGMTVLYAALGLVSSLVDFEYKKLLELVAMLGVLTLVGGAMALFAGLVGMIPVPAIAMGIAGIAVALLGMTAIISAFALLNKISGFKEFLESGGELLSSLMSILGEMAGSLVGGFAEGISGSLPDIGTDLADFATNVQPLFDMIDGVDTDGLSSFMLSLAAFVAVMTGESFLSMFTGGNDYAQLGTDLGTLGTNLGSFFTAVDGITEDQITKASALLDALANVADLPETGGVFGWFTGDIDYEGLATGLEELTSDTMLTALGKIQDLPEGAFTNLTALLNAFAGVNDLPKDGGVFQWFTGTIDFASIVTGLTELTSDDFFTALDKVQAIPEDALTSLTALLNAFTGVNDLPKEGGVFQWFTGDISFSTLSTELPNLAEAIVDFYTDIEGITDTDFSTMQSLFSTLATINDLAMTDSENSLEVSIPNFTALAENISDIEWAVDDLLATLNNEDYDFTRLDSFVQSLVSMGDETTTTALGDLATSFETVSDAVSTITDSTATLDGFKTEITTKLTEATTAIERTSKNFYNSGVFIMQGLNNGLLSMKGTLISTASSIASAIKNEINSALDINSPSGVTEESGYWTGMGQVKGMLKTLPKIKAAAGEVGTASIPYGTPYSPESSTTTSTYNESSVYTISPSFNLNISGSSSDRELESKVKRFVAEGINEVFESLERKLAY